MNDPGISSLKSIGRRRAEAFKRLGVNTVSDLLWFFPRGYEDRTRIYEISELADGEVRQFCAEVAEPVRANRIRDGLTLYKTTVFDDSGAANVTFFNTTYIGNILRAGKKYLFYGKATRFGKTFEINSPDFELVPDGAEPGGSISPVYPLTEGLTAKTVSAAVRTALDLTMESISETLPGRIIAEFGLERLGPSIRSMHLPASFEDLRRARKRLIFEELFQMSLGLTLLKDRRAATPGAKLGLPDFSLFYDRLPFRPTGAQMRAIGEGAADMASGAPMNRLVQGDVGSGKTLVAAALAWMAASNGYQTAVMAPTEILAAQHYATFTKLFEPFGLECALLTGGMPAAEKRSVLGAAASGAVKIIIGTHALLSGPVEFQKLGLSVFDEQHRFSVKQRHTLAAKGDAPHSLIMSATPIPRTLGLIIYGDLDVSVLDETLPGRQKIDTFCVGEKMRPRIEAFVRKQIGEGRQAFIVCPFVEEGEDADVKSIEIHAESLKNDVFKDLRVGILHGGMRPADKDGEMSAFADGSYDILVSTTVVEVGVDVPNASLMIIENAERYGLSQLHQLRGRVGRGEHKSYCVMFYGKNGAGTNNGPATDDGAAAHDDRAGARGDTAAAALARLEIMCKTNDGFEIAEKDLEMRGPGQFFGARQHGLPGLKLASLATDMGILKEAQAAARAVLDRDPGLSSPENRPAAGKLAALFGDGVWAF